MQGEEHSEMRSVTRLILSGEDAKPCLNPSGLTPMSERKGVSLEVQAIHYPLDSAGLYDVSRGKCATHEEVITPGCKLHAVLRAACALL